MQKKTSKQANDVSLQQLTVRIWYERDLKGKTRRASRTPFLSLSLSLSVLHTLYYGTATH